MNYQKLETRVPFANAKKTSVDHKETIKTGKTNTKFTSLGQKFVKEFLLGMPKGKKK